MTLANQHEVDTSAKMKLYLAMEIFEQNQVDLDEFYTFMEAHFARVAEWRELVK